MSFTIYSIEDDKDIALIINKTLTKQGYIVKTFYDSRSFFEAFEAEKPNMILLDMMLPDIPGTEVLKKIRSNSLYDEIDIIIISANHMVMDKVDGLDLGADDYIEKPFDILELMSRVASKVRRHKSSRVIRSDGFELDLDQRICKVNSKEIQLTVKEYDILAFLCRNNGRVVTRDEIFEEVWKTNQVLESRTLDMHVKALRTKLAEKKDLIKTVYAIGYKCKL